MAREDKGIIEETWEKQDMISSVVRNFKAVR
jgi:hypothetical protein